MKRALSLVCLFAFCTLTLLAQTGRVSRAARTTEKSQIHLAPQAVPAGLQKIFSNLGPNQFNLYTDNYGWYVEGPLGGSFGQQFTAMPFTPNSNSQVSQVRAAIQYASGDELFYLSLYGDSGGAPGSLLAGPVTVTHLPEAGTCCALTAAVFDPPLAVTGGSQYWLVASTPTSGKGTNFFGFWEWVYQGDVQPVAFYYPSDPCFFNPNFWCEAPGNGEAAFEVLGTSD